MYEPKVIHIPVTGGLGENADPMNAGPDVLVKAENVRFTKQGMAEKRSGHTLVSASTGVTGGFGVSGTANTGEGRLVANRDRLLWLDGQALHQYAPGADTFSTKSLMPRLSCISKSVAGTNKVMAHVDQCVAFSTAGREYRVVAYSEQQTPAVWGGSVFVKVFDALTDAEVNTTGAAGGTADNTYQVNATSLDAHNVQVCAIGSSQNKLVATWCDQNSGNVWYRVLDIDTMAWGSEATLLTTNIQPGGVSNRVDVKPMGADLVMAYQTTGFIVSLAKFTVSGTTVTVSSALSALDLSATSAVATGLGVTPTIVGQTAPTIFLTFGYYDGTRNIAVARSLTVSGFSFSSAVTTVKQYTGSTAANLDYFVSSSSAVDPSDTTSVKAGFTLICGATGGNVASSAVSGHVNYVTDFFTLTDTVGVLSSTQLAYFLRTRLASTPFKSGTRWFAVVQREPGWHVVTPAGTALFNVDGNSANTVASTVGNTSSYFVVDVINGVEDASFFPRQTFMVGDSNLGWTGSASIFYAYRHVTQFVRADKLLFLANVWDQLQLRCSAHLVALTASDKYRYHEWSSREGSYISSGLPGYVDGRGFTPVCLTFEPGYLTFASGGAGPAIAGVASAVYENVDNDGNVALSPPIFESFSFSGTTSIDLYAPYQGMGWDAVNSKARSGYSATSNTHIVFYGGSSANSMYELARVEMPWGYPSSTYWGSTTITTQLTASPGVAAEGKQFIYTQGGVLANVLPPSFIGMCEYRGRLFGIDHTRRSLWCSHTIISGERARFTDDIVLDIPFDAEAVGVAGDSLVIFGKRQIGFLTGSGPAPTGEGEQFPDIQLLPYAVGCDNSRSVVRTPLGVMFQSQAGIYLLDGSLGLKFVGDRVIDQLASYPTITSAIVHPTETCVIFSAVTSAGTTGIRLVYDYRLDMWSTDSVLDGAAIISQAVVGSSVYILTYGGSVYVEDPSTNLDASAWVPMSVEFASYRPGGVQGQSRLRCIGLVGKNVGSGSDLTVSVCYDDALLLGLPAYTYTSTYTNFTAELANLQFYPARQLGRAFRVKFSDATPTGGTVGTGGGISLSGVALTVGVYSGMNRLDSAKRK